MDELTNEQIQAVEEFARGLKECFANYRKNHPDRFSDIVLDYVGKVINIHLDLAQLKFDRYTNNQAVYCGKK